MTIKILFINSKLNDKIDKTKEFEIFSTTFQKLPTLHDFHVLFIDTEELINLAFWIKSKVFDYADAKLKILEQISSRGFTFCFCSTYDYLEQKVLEKSSQGEYCNNLLNNYFFTPPEVFISNESGDTFTPEYADLGFYNPLFKNNKIPLSDISWKCHFTNLPKGSLVLGRNRAGHPVFVEIPVGSGKLVMLPYFKDKSIVANIIIKEILPQIFKEENIEYSIPAWLKDYDIPIEQELRSKLSKIQNTKKLLFTQSKPLEKAVELAFSLLGFKVKRLEPGSHADILIFDDDFKALVEVKGHSNRQAKRVELSQFFSTVTEFQEFDKISKGIFVVNHEFEKKPENRSKEGFTQDAVQLAETVGLTLITSTDLYEIIIGVIFDDMNEIGKKIIRDKIKDSSGIVKF
jgi:hypothetical protein